MTDWAEAVVSKWRVEGVKINSNASVDSIFNAEAVLGFKFPDDFKQLYLKMDGFRDLDWQEHMFHFWPLNFIIKEFEESIDKNFIGFCDFLIASHSIGFRKDSPGIFKVYSIDSEYHLIAQTFQDVVHLINTSDDIIY